ncbi:Mss4-like protein, partial [Tricladium varicosporioides]
QAKNSGHRHEDVEGEQKEWKFRAPHEVHEKNVHNFKALYEGSCHCGRVQYQLSREKPLDTKYCHCSTCQKHSGAPFQWAANFHKEDIKFLSGHHDLGWYDSSEKTTCHKLPCKVSCAYCRAPITDEGRRIILLFPSLIKFKTKEEKKNFDPTCHMFYSKRLLDIPDGLPKWSGMQNDSDLIEGTPPEAQRKRERGLEEKEDKEKNSAKTHRR